MSVIDAKDGKVLKEMPVPGQAEFPVVDGKGLVWDIIEDKSLVLKRAFEKVWCRLAVWNPEIPMILTSPMPNGTIWNRWCPPPNQAAVPPSTHGVKS
jgi:hypothetical protein